MLSFEGNTVHVSAKLLGMESIQDLLRSPRVAIEAVHLAGLIIDSSKIAPSPGIELVDPATIRNVRAELKAVDAELEGLAKNDWARRGKLRSEERRVGKECR